MEVARKKEAVEKKSQQKLLNVLNKKFLETHPKLPNVNALLFLLFCASFYRCYALTKIYFTILIVTHHLYKTYNVINNVIYNYKKKMSICNDCEMSD